VSLRSTDLNLCCCRGLNRNKDLIERNGESGQESGWPGDIRNLEGGAREGWFDGYHPEEDENVWPEKELDTDHDEWQW